MIKAVIFDLWETLVYHTCPRPTREALLALGCPYEHPYTRMLEEVLMIKRHKSRKEALSELCIKLGKEPTDDILRKLESLWDGVHEKTTFYPDVLETLTSLQKKGYSLGLVSNTTAFSSEHLDSEIRRLFDKVVLSCDEGMLKPDREIFELALKRLAVNPEEAVMIGDYPPSDMACRGLGIRGILLDRRAKYADSSAEWDFRINSLVELVPLLEKINSKK